MILTIKTKKSWIIVLKVFVFVNTGKLIYLELVRTEEKLRDIREFEKLNFEFVTIVTPKHFILFHIENKLT